jgi:hypothetical protein
MRWTTMTTSEQGEVIIACYVSGPEWGEIDTAVVKLTRGRAAYLLELMDRVRHLKELDSNVRSLSLYQGDCAFGTFDYDNYLSLHDAEAFGSDFVLMEGDLPEFEEARTELDRIDIYEDDAWWSATPKHTDDYVETASLSRAQLAAIVAGKPALRAVRFLQAEGADES